MTRAATTTASGGGSRSGAGERLLRALARDLPPDPASALARLRRQRVPVAAVAAFHEDLPPALAAAAEWQTALRAEADRAERLRRATAIVEDRLAAVPGLALAGDALGREWAADVDVFATPEALPAASAALRDAGAVALDALVARVGGRRPPSGRPARHFAIFEGGELLGRAELSTALWDRGAPAAAAIARAVPGPGLPRLAPEDAARRRVAKLAAARRATVRGAVELVALLDRDVPLPRGAATAAALRRHAPVEARLAGPGPLAEAALAGRRGPSRDWVRARLRAVRREGGRRLRPRQLRVAFCGIDGAGKSTQVALLVANLERAGIGATASWTRLGNGASAPVEALARLAQRLLPRGTHSFQATRAAAGRQMPPDAGGGVPQVAPPRTRRGLLGWSWALAVTIDYVARARAAARRARGTVLVLDRALPDALVELRDDYGVALRLGLQRRLLARLTPRPHAVCYLRLPGAVAKARKDDMFTAAELDLQILAYERELAALPGVVALDAQRPPGELAREAFRAVARAVESADA